MGTHKNLYEGGNACFVGFICVTGECLTNQIACLKQPMGQQVTVNSPILKKAKAIADFLEELLKCI